MENHSLLAQKTIVRYAKTGAAVYHSHHDMIRFWERALKRAGLPMRLTQGFNPRPRMIFPHALGLGIASRCEEVELELYRPVEKTELIRNIVATCGDTLEILGVENLPPIKKSRQLSASSYRIRGWSANAAGLLPNAIRAFLAMQTIEVERGAPGDKRRLDIRPYIKGLTFDIADNSLVLSLLHTRNGSARPDEVAKLVAAQTEDDWHNLQVEKTAMTLE